MRSAVCAIVAAILAAAAPGCALVRGEDEARDDLRATLAERGPRQDARALSPQTAPVGETRTADPIAAPLALPLALALADETSERIRASGEGLHQAHLLRVQALAELLPAVTFRQSYSRIENDLPPFGGFFPTEQRTTRFELRQPIVRVSGYLALAQAGSVIRAAEARIRATRLLVEQTTAAAFYAALAAEKEVETFRAALARDEERIREVRARAATGLARRTEVLFVETDIARTRAALARALESLAAGRERLSLLVGRKVAGPLVEPPDETPGPRRATPAALAARPLPELIEEACAERPDLRALREEIDVQQGALGVALGEYAPSLDLTANYYTHRDGSFEEVDWDVAVELAFPIFEGLRTTARAREAQSRKREAELLWRNEARAIAQDVAGAWHALRAARAAIASREEELRFAEENFRLLDSEYRIGLASNLELVTAQQQLTAARLAFELERLDVKRLATELDFLTGGTTTFGERR